MPGEVYNEKFQISNSTIQKTKDYGILVKAVNQVLTRQSNLSGVIGTKFNNRKLHKDVLEHLKDTLKDAMFKTVIKDNIALAEAPSFGKNIYCYSSRSNGAKDYYSLCKK